MSIVARTALEHECCFERNGVTFTGFTTTLSATVSGRVAILGDLDGQYFVAVEIVNGSPPVSRVGHGDEEGNMDDDPYGNVVFTIPCNFSQEDHVDRLSTVTISDVPSEKPATVQVYFQATIPTDRVPMSDAPLTAIVTVAFKEPAPLQQVLEPFRQ